MGYVETDVSGCDADAVISCSFDVTYKKCIVQNQTTKSCAEQGFTTTDKSEWCDNIITCESDGSYTACVAEKQCPQSDEELAANCGDGTGGALGWTMGDTSFDKDRCPLECVAKECPSGSDTTQKAAVAGFSVVVTTGYSGDTKCTKVNSCPDGSAYSLKLTPIGEKLGTQMKVKFFQICGFGAHFLSSPVRCLCSVFNQPFVRF